MVSSTNVNVWQCRPTKEPADVPLFEAAPVSKVFGFIFVSPFT
jgi:hypothetical protein